MHRVRYAAALATVTACRRVRGVAAPTTLVAVTGRVHAIRVGPRGVRAVEEREASGFAVGQITPRTPVRAIARCTTTVTSATVTAGRMAGLPSTTARQVAVVRAATTVAAAAGAAAAVTAGRMAGLPSTTAWLALGPQAEAIAVVALAFAQDGPVTPRTSAVIAAHARAGSPGRGLRAGRRARCVAEAHFRPVAQRSDDLLLNRRVSHARPGKHPLIAERACFAPTGKRGRLLPMARAPASAAHLRRKTRLQLWWRLSVRAIRTRR